MKIITWNLMVTEDWKKLTNQIQISKEIDRQKQAWHFLVNNLNPEVALLQEVLLESINQEELGVNIFWAESHTSISNSKHVISRWGTAIYVNKKYCSLCSDVTLDVFPNEKINNTGKTKVIKLKSSCNEILFCSLHVDSTNNFQDQLISFFNKEILAKNNMIIGGDLNCDQYYIYEQFDKQFFNDIIANSNLIECEPLYKQTFFRGNPNDKNDVEVLQDDHIFVSKELYKLVETQHEDDNKLYKGKNYNYGKLKYLSDHSLVYINLNINE